MTVFFSCYFGGFCAFIADCQRCGWHFVLGAAAEGVCHTCWNVSVVETSSANACLFNALSPMWCALFTVLWTHRFPPLYTMVAVVAVFVIALATFTQSRSSTRDAESAMGDLFGIGSGAFLGLLCAITSDAARKYPDASMMAVGCLGAFGPIACSLWLEGAEVLGWPHSGVRGFVWPVLNGIIISSTASLTSISLALCEPVLFTLISLVETVTEPGLVWLVLGQAPLTSTVICGLLLLATLAAHEIVANVMEPDNENAKQAEAVESSESASESTPLLQGTKQQV
mmetsp:Transcript_48933/g.109741  ORF Transcript_48933/g.109741 Transcript_48933/m.109741 type:complete len:284 (-) Transcript_48933:46-897(-)